MTRQLLAAVLAASALWGAEATADEFYSAIRNGRMAELKNAIAKGAVDVKDRRGATPLMHAAALGTVEVVKALLTAGADVKAKNSFDATALIWGAGDAEKTRLLLDAGAEVNAKTKQGRTALMVAAATAGAAPSVRLLLAKGANVKAVDGQGGTALTAAAASGDIESLRLVLEAGADAAESGPFTSLMAAAPNLDAVNLLLSKGAKVNVASSSSSAVKFGPLALNKLTALMLAVPFASPELARTLLDAGADVNARDIRGMTPLMLAAASETQNPEVVRLLLAKGAEVNAKSTVGETALDWAAKFGNPSTLKLLEEGGAVKGARWPQTVASAAPREAPKAVEAAVALLQKSSTEFFKQSGCVGCHHQNLTALAVAEARRKGIRVDEAAVAEQTKTVKFQWTGAAEMLLQRLDGPAPPDIVMYSVLGLAADSHPSDPTMDVLAQHLASLQRTDGRWSLQGISRAPIEEGDIARTAMVIRALSVYGPPGMRDSLAKRIARGGTWLMAARPRTTDDRVMQLLGMHWLHAGRGPIDAAAKELLALQRADGGWAGNPYLDSDPYATGEALYALRTVAAIGTASAAWRRGAGYLLGSQKPDGSWYMPSRAPKFQPYFESGFPYGHDQWISAAATAWAATALASGLEPATASAK